MSNYRNNSIEWLADAFKALSNPNRLMIYLHLLQTCGRDIRCCTPDAEGVCVGDIAVELNISPSTVSHHLKELKNAGIIHTSRDGRNIICTLRGDLCISLGQFLNGDHIPVMPREDNSHG